MDPLTIIMFGLGVFILIVLILGVIYLLVHLFRGEEKKGSGHLDMYFDSNFGTIVAEWDLVTRSSLKDWKKDISTKLSSVGKDIDGISMKRKDLDGRLEVLERQVASMEK